MALSDLAVFSEFTYDTTTQIVAEQVALFNAAAQNTFILRPANHQGDFHERAMWARFSGLIRRRNAYGSGAIPQINMQMLTDNMVKIAAGTPEVVMDPGQFEWINADPEAAAASLGQQLATAMVLDMFNTAVTGLLASHLQVTGLVVNKGTETLLPVHFNAAQSKLGDRFTELGAWVMHSNALFGFYDKVLANGEQLFSYGTLNVRTDPFGRSFIVSDAPGLYVPPAGTDGAFYYTLGVKPGAVVVDQNDDFTDNWDTKNGEENIRRTYQAEWSYNLGVKGFSWDKTNGGKSPTDAALGGATNWDRVAGYNDRDLACVIIKNKGFDAAA